MMDIEIAKAVILLNLLLLFFLFLVYIRKIQKTKTKKKFLFGLLFMVIVLGLQAATGLYIIVDLSAINFAIIMALQSVAFAGVILSELSDMKS